MTLLIAFVKTRLAFLLKDKDIMLLWWNILDCLLTWKLAWQKQLKSEIIINYASKQDEYEGAKRSLQCWSLEAAGIESDDL